MFNVLLETSARRQRRAGGATLSVAMHLAIVGAVAAGTTRGHASPTREKPTRVNLVVPVQPRAKVVSEPDRSTARAPRTTAPAAVTIRHIDVPRFVPKELPPIDASPAAGGDSIVIGGAPSTGTPGGAGTIFDERGGSSNTWNTSELLMHLLTPAQPRYPETLRSAGINGRVLVEFTVDTTGRVDPATVKILSSTHELFARAVRDALGRFRFRPAEVGGKKIAALAQMPFEFEIR